MEKRVINVYKYSELDNAGKNNVKNTYDFISEKVYEKIWDVLRNNHVEGLLDARYSLSHSQGDGCSLVGSINLEEEEAQPFMNFLVGQGYIKPETWNEVLEHTDITADFERNSLSNLYCHENTVNVSINDADEQLPDDVFTDLQDGIRGWYLDVCEQMEEAGYDVVDNEDDYFSEQCDEDGWLFDRFGNRYDEDAEK